MIFVAGQLARDAQGVCVGKGDMRAQIQQVGENIKTCLEAVGATLAWPTSSRLILTSPTTPSSASTPT
jgi:enamine deaminase RidA (YjgF/YER057c/UK114 family)